MPSSDGMRKVGGFSLLEVVAVTTLFAIAAGWLMPVFGAMAGSTSTRAVSLLMGILEEARSAAVASGHNTHLIFWKRTPPQRDACLMLQEKEAPDEVASSELLSGWIPVPNGTWLGWSSDHPVGELPAWMPADSLPSSPEPSELSVLSFGPAGNVIYPAMGAVRLMLGRWKEDARDIIEVGRFSGRAIWERF